MNTHIKVLVTEGNTITKVVSLADVKSGATKIKAPRGAKIVLADETTGFAPENITVMRVGNDLHVSMEGSDLNDPDLIIENYYGSDASLIGLGEDGAYHSYIASDGDSSHFIFALENGTGSAQVLGADSLAGIAGFSAASGATGLGMLGWAALGALGLAGLIAATDSRGSGHGGGHGGGGDGGAGGGSGGNGNKLVIGEVTDNVGDKQGAIKPGDSTDDTTPTFKGSGGTPGKQVDFYDNGKLIGSTIVDANGDYEWTPENPLPDGPHEVVVIEEGKPPSDGFEFDVDTKAPAQATINDAVDDVAPRVGSIPNGGATNDNTPTFSGTAEPNAIVTIYVDGKVVGSTTADANGNWNHTPDSPLPDGPHTVTVTATDKAGNVGLPSEPYVVIVDTQAPPKPVPGAGGIGDVHDNVGDYQGTIENGGLTDDNTPTFSGSGGNPGDTVIIYNNGKEIGRAEVDANGNWEHTPQPPLPDGTHTITTIIEDAAGNQSPPSDDYVLTVDTDAPSKPAPGAGGISDVQDNVGDYQGTIGNGDVTDDNTPTFSGTGGTPGDTVIIYNNGEEIGRAEVNANGDWEFTPQPPLPDGTHTITTVIQDPAGNKSPPSDDYVVIVDTVAPSKPLPGAGGIDGAHDNVGDDQGNVENGGYTDDDTPTFSGSGGNPGDKVIIKDGDKVIGEAEVDANGDWEFTPPSLPDGAHPITVIIKDPAGNESEPSDPYVVNIDTQRPDRPTIDSVNDNVGDKQGDLTPGDTTDDARPEIRGTAEANSLVSIYNGDRLLDTVRADASGNWVYTPPSDLGNGLYNLHVTAKDAAGNVSDPSNEFDFNLVTGGTPPAPAITSVVDDQGEYQGPIDKNGVTDDTRPTINGTAQAGTTVSIYDGTTLLGTASVRGDGTWTFTPETDLPNGLRTITATSTDDAGNVSPSTGEYPIVVDTVAPGAPTGQQLDDNVGEHVGPINNGDVTDDSTPTFSGVAEPNANVDIFHNGVKVATVKADADGNFNYTPATPLPDGPHSYAGQVVDAAGNRGPMGPAINFEVDTSAVAIAITHAVDDFGNKVGNLASGSVTDDTTPTIHGTASVNSVVTITIDGTVVGSVKVGASGTWSYTPTTPLGEGPHTITATAKNPAGEVTAPTAEFRLDIDTTAPGQPSIDEVIDDVGSLQGPVENGGATDDTTPTLKGKAEPNSHIDIYDGNGKIIATATANAQGDWETTVLNPLPDGTYNLTVVATDAAGNPSAPSAPYVVTIDTVPPTTTATVTSMGKDSGVNHADFLTNDGAAGRLVQGTLSAALLAGEKVQISTDGGQTWADAQVNGLNWNALDGNSHSSNWAIQTRVVDAAGNAGAMMSQSVMFDSQAPLHINDITRSGNNFTVDIAGTGAVEGDTVRFSVGNAMVEYTLTAADISAGHATAAIPSTLLTAGAKVAASLVDSAGNASAYVTKESTTRTETFEGTSGSIDYLQKHTYGQIEITNIGLVLNSPSGDKYIAEARTFGGSTAFAFGHPVTDSQSWGVIVMGGVNFKLPEPSTYMKMDIAGLGKNYLAHPYIDWQNSIMQIDIIHTDGTRKAANISGNHPTTYKNYTFTADPGKQIASLDIKQATTTKILKFDNLEWGSDYAGPPTVIADPFHGSLDVAGVILEGSEQQDTFSVLDVAKLEATGSAIHGGDGRDTLKLTGTNQVLDFSKLAGKLSSVEVIDITGTGNNTLKLSLADVLEQGGKDMFAADGRTQMMVKGNAGDKVDLSDMLNGSDVGDWADAGTRVIEGVTYHTYQHSGLAAELLVQDGVTTNLLNG